MDIYLVKICEHTDKSLYIERKPVATTNDSYIAISHVWGDPATITPTQVDGAGKVELSPCKRDILSILKIEEICGDSWFWMDLFCIDQSPHATITISDQLMAIPNIYKSSQCVKILIEYPVCTAWQFMASRVAEDGVRDVEIFNEEELRHSRKCPNLLILDPWFDRLWTRQEGLYAMKIQVVTLNPVNCTRFATSLSQRDRWVTAGEASLKRNAVDAFITDKLAYHGISTNQETIGFRFYLDLVYGHRVDVRSYGGVVGPHCNYSPFGEAWRSGRQTTKTRDYVLAIFPDVEGYRAPPNARRLSFEQLLLDAFEQVVRHGQKFYFVSKVSKGMMMAVCPPESKKPWIIDAPTNITEAFDSFLVLKASVIDSPDVGHRDARVFVVAHSVGLEPIDFSREALPDLVKLWESTADTIRHMIYAAPSGPCTGASRIAQTKEGLLHRYLGHQFARSAVAKHCSEERFKDLRPHGVVNFNDLHLAAEAFDFEIKRFLICLVCGTTLRTATMILDAVEFRLILTTYGKLIALINRSFLLSTNTGNFILVSNGLSDYQGFQVAVKGTDGESCHIVGRTLIPNVLVNSSADISV